MTFDELAHIDWEARESTADWTKLLNELMDLTRSEATREQRALLADQLDAFADHSSSDDLEAMVNLDRSARKAARALRLSDIGQSVRELQAASADFQDAVKTISAASATLKKEAGLLRADKLNAAASSLTDTILSLKALSQSTASDSDSKLTAAISQAMDSAQKLRALLEKPG